MSRIGLRRGVSSARAPAQSSNTHSITGSEGTTSRDGFGEAVAEQPAFGATPAGQQTQGVAFKTAVANAVPVLYRGHRARMRKELLARGPESLTDHELLEMLLVFAAPKGDMGSLSRVLIKRFGSFARVLTTPAQVLQGVQGLGVQSAAAIKLVQAAAVRLARADVMGQPVLNNWDLLMGYLNTVLARESIEQFRVLFLDGRNRLLADEAQARGTIDHTPVYPREVVKRALELHATALILVHNHPSGDPTPSREDIDMTREIQKVAAVMGLVVHDHVVIGNGRWISFKRDGLLEDGLQNRLIHQ